MKKNEKYIGLSRDKNKVWAVKEKLSVQTNLVTSHFATNNNLTVKLRAMAQHPGEIGVIYTKESRQI